jgi:NAD(P)-dependent dehydrogenase (short-subunit alcohol dehydrogenase family)
MAAVNDRFGRIDALINIAGGFRWQTIHDGDPQTWDELHRLNVISTLNASIACLPYLRRAKAGRIVNIGATAALKAATGMGAYAAAKSAVHRLTESLAEELKAEGITVNAVLPSIIDTPANRKDMPDADRSKWVAPAELAAVILFLASDAASALTGALIPVTGRG